MEIRSQHFNIETGMLAGKWNPTHGKKTSDEIQCDVGGLGEEGKKLFSRHWWVYYPVFIG